MAEFDPAFWVADTLTKTRAPAVVVGVLDHEGPRVASGGLRSRGGDSPVTDGDVWHIGSNTKSMTATLVARLAEAGVIEWDDTVGKVLEPVVSDITPAFADLTYADLMTHRAGLPANLPMSEARKMMGTVQSRDMMADRLTYSGIILSKESKPKGRFLYSNAGYVIAGTMLQQSTGQTWENLMQTHLFDPLGLSSAGFGAPAADQPQGHGMMLGLPKPSVDNIPAMGPAGTVHMSAGDMLLYLAAHAQRRSDFLTQESWERLHSATAAEDGINYALGWNVLPNGWLGHDGSNTLWYSVVRFHPGENRAVVLSTNFAGLGRPARRLTAGAEAAMAD